MEAADRLQLRGEVARLGGDQRPGPGLDQSGGHGERRALVAALRGRRDDLEDGAAGKGRPGPAPERSERVLAHATVRRRRARLTDGRGSVNPLRSARREAPAPPIAKDALVLAEPRFFTVGNLPSERRIAFRRRAPARTDRPGLVWLCGYRSDMDSTKASALDAEAERLGLGLLRFDYSGHGRSDGRLEDGTISRWLEEALAVLRAETTAPQILIGSSMGGYLALLATRA